MPKNILFIVPYVPNLVRVRPYHLIRSLAERGHRLTLLTLWSDEQEKAGLADLSPYVDRLISAPLPRWRSLWNSLAALPSRTPLQSVYCWEPALVRQIDALFRNGSGAQQFDVVHVEHLRGAHYGLHVKALARQSGWRLPVVWDSVDSISLLFRQASERSKSLFSRSLTRLELGRTERYEGWLASQFDRVTVTSPYDRDTLVELVPGNLPMPVIDVLPNGVDLDYFSTNGKEIRQPETLVISGKMSYHANVTMVLNFVHNIMPRIWEHRPGVRLQVVGKDPVREIQALGVLPNVTVTGTVPHLPPYLKQAAVAVAPIAYGAGIQNKVLEAMACATPVVASSKAVSAIQARHGQEVMVADQADDFAEGVLFLLDHPEQARQLGQAGRGYVESHHNWNRIGEQLDHIYDQVIREV